LITILGAGLTGLSCSYHLGHDNCVLFDRNSYAGGHIYSHHRDGFVWDEGPHVSFTKNPYVRQLLESSVHGEFLEYPVSVSNYYKGSWIPHPAQSNLYAVPEPLRSDCLDDFLKTRTATNHCQSPTNYAEWLQQAFGDTFARNFPAIYTRKYWTRDAKDLSTDWVGDRVFFPDVETVLKGYQKPAEKATHYIKSVRYPSRGGYISFAQKLCKNANIRFNHDIKHINLKERQIFFFNGKQHSYRKLISTIPLPELIRLSIDAPANIREAAKTLSCTSLLLVNVSANHSFKKPYHWLYVYDEDKLSTRINHIGLLSPNNTPSGKTGVQVEVYASRHQPFRMNQTDISAQVVRELQEMNIIDKPESVHTSFIPYANVIFDNQRRAAQNHILSWLETYGLKREDDDLEPITKWDHAGRQPMGNLILAGRFGQWKYFFYDTILVKLIWGQR